MMWSMNTRYSSPAWGAFVLLIPLLCPSALIAAETAKTGKLPPGVTMRSHPVSGANQVWIDVGPDLLAVDVGPHVSSTDRAPTYRIATGNGITGTTSAAGSAGELWPRTRPLDASSQPHGALVFDEDLSLSSASRTVVALDLGRCRTAGDAVVWLPAERVLIAGGLVSPGRVEATPESDTVAWTAALERLRDLGPEVVIPGRGEPGGAEMLAAQLQRLTELRGAVKSTLLSGGTADDMIAAFRPPWFVAWNGVEQDTAQRSAESVYDEISGLRTPWLLVEDRGLRAGPSLTAGDAGWAPPRKVLWRNYWPERLAALQVVAPGVEIIPFDTPEEAVRHVADADGLIGTATPDLLAAGEKLRWVQVGSAGVERYLAIPELADGRVLLTNGQRMASPEIAEHVMALTRALARNLHGAVLAQADREWRRPELGDSPLNRRLRGKTLLVVGLGGIGTEVARLADAAGMRVTAIRSSRRSGPPFVARVGLSDDLFTFAGNADVVVNCLPLTPQTADLFNDDFFDAMRDTAFFINVGRGGTVNTASLIHALENGQIAAAGLDVTDPEPLPEEHPLWRAPNLIITPHYAAWSDVGRERRWLLYRENLRRFAAGEPLLSVVNPTRGY